MTRGKHAELRVVVVGAGLVGLALAIELKQRGARVTVLEKSIPGAEASTAAAGILGPQLEHDDDGPTLALGLAGVAATKRLLAQCGPDVDVDAFDSAAVKLAFDDVAAAALAKRVGWQRARGLRAELVDGARARAQLPWLAGDVVSAALFPDDHCLDPRKYGAALATLARARRRRRQRGRARGPRHRTLRALRRALRRFRRARPLRGRAPRVR